MRFQPYVPQYCNVTLQLFAGDVRYDMELQRSDDLGTTYTQLGVIPAGTYTNGYTFYTDSVPQNSAIYLYRNRHTLTGRQAGNWSVIKVDMSDPYKVDPPNTVVISSGVGSDRLSVLWNAPSYSGDLDHYEVFSRKVTGSITSSNDTSYHLVGTAPPDQTQTVLVGGVRTGDTWQGAVLARNKNGLTSSLAESANYVMATYGFASASFSTPIASTGSIAYSASFDTNTAYVEVYAGAGSQSADTATPGETDHYFEDTMLQSGIIERTVEHSFTWLKVKMIAYNGNGERGTSSPVYSLAIPQPPPGTTYTSSLQAPTSLSGSAESSTQIKVSWVNPADGYTNTKVYRDGTLVSTKAIGVTTDTQTGLTSATTYSFDAKHYSSASADYSGFAGAISKATQKDTLATPINVSAYAPAGAGSSAHVAISWGYPDSITPGASTVVERSDTSGGALTVLTTVGPGVSSYIDVDDSLRFTTKYFKVKFTKDNYTDSALSAEVSSEYLRDGDSPQ